MINRIILILFLTICISEYNNPNGKPGLLNISFNIETDPDILNDTYPHKPGFEQISIGIILPINKHLTLKGKYGPKSIRHEHEFPGDSYKYHVAKYSYGIEMHIPIKIFKKY